jgi:hypothetical protein
MWLNAGARTPGTAADGGDFVYIFNHIPRSAGGAVGRLLGSILRPVFDYPGPTANALRDWLASPVALESLPPGSVLMGHYTAPGGRLHERYPIATLSPRYRLVTILRDPWSWACSHLRYFGVRQLECERVEEVLDKLSGTYARALNVPALTPSAALDRYWFVGTVERIQVACDCLLAELGKPRAALERINPSSKRAGPEPSQALRVRYLARAEMDLSLYRTAAARLARSV